jgi:hypothetical protein
MRLVFPGHQRLKRRERACRPGCGRPASRVRICAERLLGLSRHLRGEFTRPQGHALPRSGRPARHDRNRSEGVNLDLSPDYAQYRRRQTGYAECHRPYPEPQGPRCGPEIGGRRERHETRQDPLPITQNGAVDACAAAGFELAVRFGAELEVLHPCPAPEERLPYSTELSPIFRGADRCRQEAGGSRETAGAQMVQQNRAATPRPRPS